MRINGRFVRCTSDDRTNWVRSPASGLHQGLPLTVRNQSISENYALIDFLTSRGSSEPREYHYKRESFGVRDFALLLDQDVVHHLSKLSSRDPSIWHKALQLILSDSAHW